MVGLAAWLAAGRDEKKKQQERRIDADAQINAETQHAVHLNHVLNVNATCSEIILQFKIKHKLFHEILREFKIFEIK